MILTLFLAAAAPLAASAEPAPEAPVALATTVATPAPALAAAATLLRSAIAVEPAARVPLVPGTEVVVDPRATFEIELSTRSPDARLALLDARDDVVAATGARELAGGTRLSVAPSAPLVPGSRYALRLDGAVERELHDAAGRPFSPLTLQILVAGTPPPPEPRAKPQKKGKAKRRRTGP
jgi:hypothetical protein